MRIDNDVLDVLKTVVCDGSKATLTGQLDRALYVRVNKVLETLGGKWNRKARAHVFECDAAELLSDAVTTGEYVDWRKEFQFYETPSVLAERMCRIADVRNGMMVLEPSAGRGAIAREAHCFGAIVHCVEKRAELAEQLLQKGFSTVKADFLEVVSGFRSIRYGAVLMNPPFCRSQDMAHVRHAYGFLSAGGTLVAVMSPGFTFRADRKAVEFRKWFEDLGGEVETLPAGTFRESGTMANAVLVTVRGT